MKTTKTFWLIHIFFAFWWITCQAQDLNGTWKLSKSVDYESPNVAPPAPPSTALQIVNQTLVLPSNCFIKFHQQTYSPEKLFQMLVKSGESEAAIGQFMLKQFNVRLNETKVYYHADPMSSCNTLGADFILTENKLIAIRASFLFYAFSRVAPNISTTFTLSNTATVLEGLKPSALPFNIANYMAQCAGDLPTRKGIPQPTTKCAPTYFPHVASRDSKELISKLVGSHAYHRGGARHGTEDYDNPLANGLHPVFLVFPPLDDVVLVRVDDMENTENRDAISGAYLSIKNDKVVDQLNVGCDFDASYICSSPEKQLKFQLTKEGKFKKLN